MSRVPSLEPSSTMTSSFSTGPRSTSRTRETMVRMVACSLKAGITTDSFIRRGHFRPTRQLFYVRSTEVLHTYYVRENGRPSVRRTYVERPSNVRRTDGLL